MPKDEKLHGCKLDTFAIGEIKITPVLTQDQHALQVKFQLSKTRKQGALAVRGEHEEWPKEIRDQVKDLITDVRKYLEGTYFESGGTWKRQTKENPLGIVKPKDPVGDQL